MAQYKYYIEMNYINDDTNLEIKPENIKNFFIDSDYESANMPMMYAVLHLDKNFHDQIMTNAKTATITTNIYKILYNDQTETKVLTDYKGECSYFISGDINYNKEIDYATSSDTDKKREDVYKEVHIGLIYKKCIEYNKQTVNTTIKDTTMINAVASYLQNVPLLIENFTYNDTITQLVIPPQNSLQKTIAFFNSIKVFYDTPYRFFIEPACVYLISSSGKPIQKSSEKYSNIIFNIHAITDSQSNILGMEEDATNKCYRVDVNVLDTHYTIDNDTCKTVNNISSIINPSKDNSLIALGDITKSMNNVDGIKSSILNSITSKIGTLKVIPGHVSNYKVQFASSTNNVSKYTDSSVGLINQAIPIIQAVPEQQPAPPTDGSPATTIKTMSALDKSTIINKLNADKATLVSDTTKFNNLNSNFAKSSNNLMGCLGKTTTNVPSLLNAITPINISDNTSSLKSLAKSITNQNSANTAFTLSTLMPHIDNGNSIVTTTQTIITELTTLGLPELVTIISGLQSNLNNSKTEVSKVTTNLNTYKTFPITMGNIHSDIFPGITRFDNLDVNLKQQFTSRRIDIQSASSSSNSTISSVINSASDVLNTLKTKGLSLSSLSNLTKDINSVKDISQIGKIGVSKFDVNLNFLGGTTGTNSGSNSGTRIVRINNDNANQVKNIKAKMENKANKLTINKNDLDASIFTINKEYIVKNYDAHSNKDGRFLLSRKVEIFLRQDDKFLINTMLEFDKLADENKSSTASILSKTATTKTATVASTQDIVKNATTIINTIKTKGVNASDIGSLTKNATAVTQEYNQMKSSNATKSNSVVNTIINTI